METLYRKVTFEVEQQDNYKTVLIGKNANFIFNPNTRNGEELTDFLSDCEEIPNHSAQLQADKAELLEALEKAQSELLQFKSAFGQGSGLIPEIESLIQKHKQ